MTSLAKEIAELIQRTVDQGQVTEKDWITAQVMAAHPDISGEDAPFYRVLAQQRIDERVSALIGKFKPSSEVSRQLILPGFDYLQKAYLLTREGKNLLVPVDQCSDHEMLARAKEYDEMAKGCSAHAREIREYVAARQAQVA